LAHHQVWGQTLVRADLVTDLIPAETMNVQIVQTTEKEKADLIEDREKEKVESIQTAEINLLEEIEEIEEIGEIEEIEIEEINLLEGGAIDEKDPVPPEMTGIPENLKRMIVFTLIQINEKVQTVKAEIKILPQIG